MSIWFLKAAFLVVNASTEFALSENLAVTSVSSDAVAFKPAFISVNAFLNSLSPSRAIDAPILLDIKSHPLQV